MHRRGSAKYKPNQIDHIVAFTRRLKIEQLGLLKLQSEEIQMSGEVKYLGVVLDPRLTWKSRKDKKEGADSADTWMGAESRYQY